VIENRASDTSKIQNADGKTNKDITIANIFMPSCVTICRS